MIIIPLAAAQNSTAAYFHPSTESGDIKEYLQPVYIFEGDYQWNDLIEPFEPVTINAINEGVQDTLIPVTPSYTPEVNTVTANFSAPITNTIIARNSTR